MAATVVFMGGKEIGYHCLNHLLLQGAELEVEVTAVLSSGRMLFEPDLSIEALCEAHGIPVLASLEDFLEHPEPDFIVSVQYHEILKARHINRAQKLAMNLHMAPLPEYRGCNQFSFAILDEAKTFGTTIHQLETGIDSGDILAEQRFELSQGITAIDLYHLTYKHSLELFEGSIGAILSGQYSPVSQASLEATRGTSYHFRHEINAIKVVEPHWPEAQIKRHICATWFPPFEPPWMMLDGKKMYLSPDWEPGDEPHLPDRNQ